MNRQDHPGNQRITHGQIAITKCYCVEIVGSSPDPGQHHFSGAKK
jgi:hypothetical protein